MSKKILITGSTDGIGKIAAKQLAAKGHTIFIHGRNREKLLKVVREVKKETGNKNIDGFVGDLSYVENVYDLSNKIKERVFELDVLVNNAGVFKSRIVKNKNNLDLRFVVNYLAPFVITQEMLPLLKRSKDARIINLSSAAQAPVSIPALNGDKNITDQESYAQSKLALTMWSFALAKKYPEITITALNPGSLLNTNMVKEAYGTFWSSANKGANMITELAEHPLLKGKTGLYFDNDKGEEKGQFAKAHVEAYDLNKIETLLQATEKILDLH